MIFRSSSWLLDPDACCMWSSCFLRRSILAAHVVSDTTVSVLHGMVAPIEHQGGQGPFICQLRALSSVSFSQGVLLAPWTSGTQEQGPQGALRMGATALTPLDLACPLSASPAMVPVLVHQGTSPARPSSPLSFSLTTAP